MIQKQIYIPKDLIMKKIIFISFFLLGAVSFLSAHRTTTVDEETTYLHLDKSFYVTGEIIWYKLYLGASFKDQEVTIRSTIANQDGRIVGNEFLKTGGKPYLDGYYKIPFDANTGQYLLQFTGINKADGTTVTLAKVDVPIYNDLQAFPKISDQKMGAAPATDFASQLNVDINLSKTNFKPRENVTASVKVTDKAGNPIKGSVSVTVVDKELLKAGIVTNTTIPVAAAYEEKIYVQGKVYNQQGQPLSNSIMGAFSGNEEAIYYSKIDQEGNFTMEFQDFHGEKPIQFLGDAKGIEYIDVKVQESLSQQNSTPLHFDDAISNYLTYSRQRKKIFQHYTTLESDVQVASIKEKLSKRKPNQEWNIKEYEYFEYMYIFFKENLSPLRFKFNSDSTYTASMYNPSNQSNNKFFSGKPLFIIDNVATRDANYVARMGMEEIKKVELFFRLKDLNKQFKLFGSSGVVKITTYNPLNKLPVQETKNNYTISGLQPKATFPVFMPDKLSGLRQPFFRPQVYWNPDIQSNKAGTASVNWYQTDDRSTFLIQVVVQGENGEMGYATKEFVVE